MSADDIIKVWEAVFANYCCGWLLLAVILCAAIPTVKVRWGARKEQP